MSREDLIESLRDMAAALLQASREGDGAEDDPEGQLTIQISDTMARQMAQTLDQAAAALGEPGSPLDPRPLVSVSVECPDAAAAGTLAQRLEMALVSSGRVVVIPPTEAMEAKKSADARAETRCAWLFGDPAPGSVAATLSRAKASTHPGSEAFPLITALDQLVLENGAVVEAMAEEVEGYFDDMVGVPNDERAPWIEALLVGWYHLDPDRRAAISADLRQRFLSAFAGVLKGLRP